MVRMGLSREKTFYLYWNVIREPCNALKQISWASNSEDCFSDVVYDVQDGQNTDN